jgi:hypothetical protein
MPILQNHIIFHDLSEEQISQVKYEINECQHGHIAYLYDQPMEIINTIEALAHAHQLSLKHFYVSKDFNTYGIKQYVNGSAVELEVDIYDYYKMCEEILGIDYFCGHSLVESDHFMKGVVYFCMDFMLQATDFELSVLFVDSSSAIIKIHNSEDEYRHVCMALDKETGKVSFNVDGNEVITPDLSSDDGISILEDFIEETLIDFLEEKDVDSLDQDSEF